jgi:hypothetical protein
MTFVFPFQGARGGFFHSGAAVQPLLWALAPVGLTSFLEWGGRTRGWNLDQARRVFGFGALALALLLTALVSLPRLFDLEGGGRAWGEPAGYYAQIEEALAEMGIGAEEIVMVNNPPGYFVATGRMAIAVPDGETGATLAAARRYQATFLILEANHPQGLAGLYENPGDRPGLDYISTIAGAHLFELNP